MDRRSKTLTLDRGILARGEGLADEDRRTLSAEIEWLIEQEFRRRLAASKERKEEEA